MNGTSALEGLRRELRVRWPEWTAITLFAAVVAFAIPYHEPWADEAQAWQLSRYLSLRELFQTYIRYEGSPGLWHFFLWVLNRAHVSYAGMHWICGGIALASTSLLVICSPFPRYLKLTLPFTFFLLFQYAVVARSYVLAPLLLFMVAAWWKKNPLVVSVALGLLANCALHASVISGGLAIVWLAEQLCPGRVQSPVRGRMLLLCASIVLAFYAFALWTAWPPKDFAGHISLGRQLMPPFYVSAIGSMIVPICQPTISVLFWIAIIPVFIFRRSVICLLPVPLFALFSGTVFCYFWHFGLMVPLLICLLWITWPSQAAPVLPAEIVGRAALIWMIGTQIVWSAYSIRFDHYNYYSPNLAAAQLLMPLVKGGATVTVTYLEDSSAPGASSNVYSATGILPYFDHNIYMNQPYPFYLWSDKNPSDKLFDALLPSHPNIIVAETLQGGSNPPTKLVRGKRAEMLTKSGYRLTNVFCGSLPFSTHLAFTNCHVIFQYTGDAP